MGSQSCVCVIHHTTCNHYSMDSHIQFILKILGGRNYRRKEHWYKTVVQIRLLPTYRKSLEIWVSCKSAMYMIDTFLAD